MLAKLLPFPAASDAAPRNTEDRSLSEILGLLNRVSAIADQIALSSDRAMEKMFAEVCEFTGWPIGHLYKRCEGELPTFATSKVWHLSEEIDPEAISVFRQQSEETVFSKGKGIIGIIAESGEAKALEDVTVLDQFLRADAARASGVRGFFGFPIFLEGEVIAVAEFYGREAGLLDQVSLEMMTYVSSQIARVFERARFDGHRKELMGRFQSSVQQAVQHMSQTSGELSAAAGHLSQQCTLSQASCTKAVESTSSIEQGNVTLGSAMVQLKDAGQATDTKTGHVITTVDQVAEEIQRAVRELDALSQVAEDIDSIVQNVSGIAGQTRMLGLNAFIEASRVGEDGKGFAIVASEIKSLANDSEQASRSIARQVAEIQDMVRKSADNMIKIGVSMSELETTAHEMTEVLKGQQEATDLIGDQLDTSRTSIEGITSDMSATSQAMTSLTDLSNNLRDLAISLQDTTKTVEHSSDEFMEMMRV